MSPSDQSAQPAPAGMLNISGVTAHASFDQPPASGDFDELLHWCDSFSDTLHDIIDQLQEDMMRIGPPSGAATAESADEPESSEDWRQITDVVDQIYDIVAQLERVSKRATPVVYRA